MVNCGLGMLSFEGTPVVWLQRGASPQYGRESYTLEVMSPKPEVMKGVSAVMTPTEEPTMLPSRSRESLS